MKKLLVALCLFTSLGAFAQTKISALPVATGKGQGMTVPVVQGGVTKQLPIGNILSYADSLAAFKQATLVSGSNIKTINGIPVIGAGDVTITGGGGTSNPLAIINPQLRGVYYFNALFTGQSNVVGGSTSIVNVDTSFNPRIQVWDGSKFKTAINGQAPFSSTVSPTTAFFFGKRYIAEHPLDTFRFIIEATSGEQITNWHNGVTPQVYLNSLISKAVASGITRTDMLVWGQGESVTGTETKEDYLPKQDSIFAVLRRQSWFSKDTRILVQGMPDVISIDSTKWTQSTSLASTSGNVGAVDKWKQLADYDGDPFTVYVPTVRVAASAGNEIHFNALGIYELGYNRMYKAYQSLPRNFLTEQSVPGGSGGSSAAWLVGGNPPSGAGFFDTLKIGTKAGDNGGVGFMQNGRVRMFVNETGALQFSNSAGVFGAELGAANNFNGGIGVNGPILNNLYIRSPEFYAGSGNVNFFSSNGTTSFFYSASDYKFFTQGGGVLGLEVTPIGTLISKQMQTSGYTVATLPTGSVGMTAYVTDASSPTYLGTLTGGGTVTCPVFYNGSAWVSH